MPATHRSQQNATGVIRLGMVDEGARELETISSTDRFYAEVLRPLLERNWREERWGLVVALARIIISHTVSYELPWLALAGAFREMGEVQQAREVLLNAERHHGKTCAILHFNLACYSALVGKQDEAAKSCRHARRLEQGVRRGATGQRGVPLSNPLRCGRH